MIFIEWHYITGSALM